MGIWIPVRGKFDKGSNADIVSEDVIKRAGLESFVTKTEKPVTLEMSGTTFTFNEKISLSWLLNNHEKSYSGDFWVAPNTDNFDLIIGEPWLVKHGYNIMAATKSHSKTSAFLQVFDFRLPWSGKCRLISSLNQQYGILTIIAERTAEEATAAVLNAEAMEELRKERIKLAQPKPVTPPPETPPPTAPPPDPSAVAGSTSTGTAGPNTQNSPQGPDAIT